MQGYPESKTSWKRVSASLKQNVGATLPPNNQSLLVGTIPRTSGQSDGKGSPGMRQKHVHRSQQRVQLVQQMQHICCADQSWLCEKTRSANENTPVKHDEIQSLCMPGGLPAKNGKDHDKAPLQDC